MKDFIQQRLENYVKHSKEQILWNWVSIGAGNSLLPVQHQAIT